MFFAGLEPVVHGHRGGPEEGRRGPEVLPEEHGLQQHEGHAARAPPGHEAAPAERVACLFACFCFVVSLFYMRFFRMLFVRRPEAGLLRRRLAPGAPHHRLRQPPGVPRGGRNGCYPCGLKSRSHIIIHIRLVRYFPLFQSLGATRCRPSSRRHPWRRRGAGGSDRGRAPRRPPAQSHNNVCVYIYIYIYIYIYVCINS